MACTEPTDNTPRECNFGCCAPSSNIPSSEKEKKSAVATSDGHNICGESSVSVSTESVAAVVVDEEDAEHKEENGCGCCRQNAVLDAIENAVENADEDTKSGCNDDKIVGCGNLLKDVPSQLSRSAGAVDYSCCSGELGGPGASFDAYHAIGCEGDEAGPRGAAPASSNSEAIPEADNCSCCDNEATETRCSQDDASLAGCCRPAATNEALEAEDGMVCCDDSRGPEDKDRDGREECKTGYYFVDEDDKEALAILGADAKATARLSSCRTSWSSPTKPERKSALTLHALCGTSCPQLAKCLQTSCYSSARASAACHGTLRRGNGPSTSRSKKRQCPWKRCSGSGSASEAAKSEDGCPDDCCRTGGTDQAGVPKKEACCKSSTSGKCARNFGVARITKCSNDGIIATLTESPSIDLEKATGGKERVAVSVQGMTCTGCETKLSRALAAIPGVSNTQTSLVLSRAEFDVNTGQVSVEGAIAALKRMTGFECQQMANKGSHKLDVLVDEGDEAMIKMQPLPPGVVDIASLYPGALHISYDPMVVGARDLIENVFGRPLKLAPPQADPSLEAGNRHVRKVGLMTVLSVVLTVPVLVLEWAALPSHDILYGSISVALATIIQIVVAGPFYVDAFKSLIFTGVIEMDMLIVLSTSAAYIFSVVAFAFVVRGHPLSTGEFFETSTLVVTLIMVGRFVSAIARQKAVESISVRSLQQPTALLVQGDESTVREIDARLLQYGDVFRVMPAMRIPTDGIIISGTSEVDESVMTGESMPIEKAVKFPVVAGSVNGSGTLDVRLTSLLGDNSISTIANMVDEAKLSKPRTQDIADRVAGYFVPVVATLSIITFVVWIAVGIAVRHQSSSEAVVQATTYAVAVLIISCPCAIGLAVPMVIVIAGGVAANRGVIFKTAEALETARKINHVVFDKTGTLTTGKLNVSRVVHLGGNQAETLSATLGLLADIKHPVSRAVTRHLQNSGVTPVKLSDIKAMPGKGVQGQYGSKSVRAGSPHWLGLESHPNIAHHLLAGSTILSVTVSGDLKAVFLLDDSVRPEAPGVLRKLSEAGISISIVSGDNSGAVASVASVLGVPSSHALGQHDPAAKAGYISSLRSRGVAVMFVGDGTNDAVALATAQIGLHVSGDSIGDDGPSTTSDVARGAADAVLLRPDLRGVCVLIELSRAAYRRVVLNFAWSFVYNLFAVLLAAGAFVVARIPPAYAGLGELVSVLPVIAAAVQLQWTKFSIAK